MRTLVALAVTAALSPTAHSQTAPQSGIDRAAWLAGCWEQRAPGRLGLEMWMPPFGGSMFGASRTVIGGAVREFEYLRLTARGDTIVYTAIPSGQRQTDFRSVSVGSTEIVFENRAHDFPQVVKYRRAGADSIVARIEGPGPNNTTRGIDFPMRRVSCTEIPAPPPAPPPPAPPTDSLVFDAEPSPDGRQLVLVKGWGQNWEVFVGNADGTAQRTVSAHAAIDYQPTWSRDGQRIAFTSVRDGHQEIYTVRPDGSELTQLTRGTAHNSEPSWSPDGRRIVFRSERDGGRPHIYVMNADGTDQRALTRDTLVGASPTWSPDGRSILFNSTRTTRNEVYVMNLDGSGQRMLTNTPQQSGAATRSSGVPMWSPDGRTIAFWSTRDGNDEVYVMNADGTNVRNVTNNPARDVPVSWSPDGAYILFRSNRDRAQNEIYRIRVDGTGVERITTTVTPPR